MFWWLLSNCAIIMILLHVVNDPNILCCYFVYMHLHQGLRVIPANLLLPKSKLFKNKCDQYIIHEHMNTNTHLHRDTHTHILWHHTFTFRSTFICTQACQSSREYPLQLLGFLECITFVIALCTHTTFIHTDTQTPTQTVHLSSVSTYCATRNLLNTNRNVQLINITI